MTFFLTIYFAVPLVAFGSIALGPNIDRYFDSAPSLVRTVKIGWRGFPRFATFLFLGGCLWPVALVMGRRR